MKTNFLLLSCLSLLGLQSIAQSRPKPFHKQSRSQHQNLEFSKKATQYLPQLKIKQWWETADWSTNKDSTHFVYDLEGRTIEENSATERTRYTYDNQGRMIGSIRLDWNNVTERWDSANKRIYTYDLMGNEASFSSSYYFNNTWIMNYGYRDTYIYNNQNLLVEEISEEWISDTTYQYTFQALFTNNNQGQPSEVEILEWDDDVYAFIKSYKATNIQWYQWTGILELSLYTSMNLHMWVDSVYVLTNRETYTYDNHQNETENIFESFDGTNWTIDYANKYLLTYNNNGALTEKILQLYNHDSSNYINYIKETFTDFVSYTAVKAITENRQNVSLYPNPTTSAITIELSNGEKSETISIYNLTGTKVLQSTLNSNQNRIDVSLLPKGLYIYKLQSGTTGKLMIN